jgi:hypothetical protein
LLVDDGAQEPPRVSVVKNPSGNSI